VSDSDYSYAADVAVSVCEPLTFTDLAPVLDAFTDDQYMNVRVDRMNSQPPMAGALDMVLGIAILYAGIGGVEFVRKFAGMLAEDTYRAIRDRLRRLRDTADQRAPERVWTLTIRIGSHPFHFKGSMTDEQFKHRLRAAQAILDRSPDRLIEGHDTPHEMEPGWYWHDDHWEATPLLALWVDGRDG